MVELLRATERGAEQTWCIVWVSGVLCFLLSDKCVLDCSTAYAQHMQCFKSVATCRLGGVGLASEPACLPRWCPAVYFSFARHDLLHENAPAGAFNNHIAYCWQVPL